MERFQPELDYQQRGPKPWYNGDYACFPSGSNTSVTISGGTTVSPASIYFSGGGYTISGGTLALSSTSTTNITASTGTDTINSAVTCSSVNGGITKLGSGTLSLANANGNSSSVVTNINGGVLNFTQRRARTSGTISFGGGTLQWASGNTGNTQDIGSRSPR